jgi:hypothetical protein
MMLLFLAFIISNIFVKLSVQQSSTATSSDGIQLPPNDADKESITTSKSSLHCLQYFKTRSIIRIDDAIILLLLLFQIYL